jgi:hypothetical protein
MFMKWYILSGVLLVSMTASADTATLKDLPTYVCNYGYKASEEHIEARQPMVIQATDAKVAVSTMSALIASGKLGFPLNYVQCNSRQ